MNELNKTLLLCACILAFTTLLFFFKFAAQKARSEDLLAQKEAAYVDARKSIKQAESQNEKATDAQKTAQLAEKNAQENFTKVSEVVAELERLEAASAIEQIESAAQAKARLEREVALRIKSEKQLEMLSLRNESLERDLLLISSELESLTAENTQRIRLLEAENLKKVSELKAELERTNNLVEDLKIKLGKLGGENTKLKKDIEEKEKFIKLSTQSKDSSIMLSNPESQSLKK